MTRMRTIIATAFALLPIALVVPGTAHAETRVALVVGNAAYQAGALNTPANDAGLIAQTLQAAGFDVVGARDLDQDSLRRAFRDFLDKATSSGPDTVAFVYLSGYGVQLEGENYFVPIDARIARDADVTAEALRISDYTRPLAALKLKAGIVVLDLARANPFAKSGPPLAGGLALAEPEPGLLLALNAAPGTVAPEGPGPYGPYAQALAEMMREGGLPLAGIFDRARLRVNDLTKGAEVPWHASKVEASLVFFERAADAPAPAVSTEQTAAIRARPIRELAAQEAYIAALERDTLEGYGEFLAAYADDPMAGRVRAIIAARREALTWRRTRVVDTPPAYWSYLRRYPQGPHAADAHRRLAFLAAALEPPPSFAALAYDLPPPPPEEIVFIQRPVLMFDDPDFAFAAPPPPPVVFLAPPPPEFVLLPPPPPPVGLFLLPIPIYRPVPVWVRPPAYVAPPPPNNVIYSNVHNTVVISNVTNTVTITNPSGQTQTLAPPPRPAAQPQGAPTAAPLPAALGPALPPSVAQKAVTLQSQ
ncbi:MAG: caspase family protein, partial [Xanthobacteraceae bacterium]